MKIERNIPVPKCETKIDHEVPIPSRGKWAEILDKMSKGDSVLFTESKHRISFIQICRYRGVKVITRRVEGGWRVWVERLPLSGERNV